MYIKVCIDKVYKVSIVCLFKRGVLIVEMKPEDQIAEYTGKDMKEDLHKVLFNLYLIDLKYRKNKHHMTEKEKNDVLANELKKAGFVYAPKRKQVQRKNRKCANDLLGRLEEAFFQFREKGTIGSRSSEYWLELGTNFIMDCFEAVIYRPKKKFVCTKIMWKYQ